MTLPQAKLELALWQAEADTASSSYLYIRLAGMGLAGTVSPTSVLSTIALSTR